MRNGRKVIVRCLNKNRGICACCKYHQSVDIGEKLVSVRFEFLNMAATNRALSVQHVCALPTAPTQSLLHVCVLSPQLVHG